MDRRRALVLTLALLMLAAVAGAWYLSRRPWDDGRETAAANDVRFHCVMHPTMVSDRPCDCPICNMRMVPIGD